MAKSFGGDVNGQLRDVARSLIAGMFDGNQSKFAEAVGVSATFVSDFLSEKRGAGLDLLVGLSKYAPLVVMGILEIDIPAVLSSAVQGGDRVVTREEEQMERLPVTTVRALRAAIELTGSSVAEAVEAAAAAFDEYGDLPGTDADWWLVKIRERLPMRTANSSRPSQSKLLAAKPS
jgi:hypothetical protein